MKFDGQPLVQFSLEGARYALALAATEHVVRAVAITPLPGAPPCIDGVVNVHGTVVPVYGLRRRFGHPARSIRLDDQVILARTARRPVAIVVDRCEGLVPAGAVTIDAAAVLPGIAHVEAVAVFEDGLILIHDLDRFLSLEEEAVLTAALAAGKEVS